MVGSMAPSETTPIHAHHHAVQFYGDDAELLKRVGTFLSEGLVAGQPAIVIATPGHRMAIEEALQAHLIDVGAAKRLGDLVMLDAEQTLATFMVDQMPVGELFRCSLGDVIDQTLRGRERTPVRAYGEMVDVLWKQGKTEAAVRVEVLWNNLAQTHAFSLLCGYAIGNFYKQTDKYQEVCDLHTHVHAHEEKVLPFTPKAAAKTA
jgi:hypothetical protein